MLLRRAQWGTAIRTHRKWECGRNIRYAPALSPSLCFHAQGSLQLTPNRDIHTCKSLYLLPGVDHFKVMDPKFILLPCLPGSFGDS